MVITRSQAKQQQTNVRKQTPKDKTVFKAKAAAANRNVAAKQNMPQNVKLVIKPSTNDIKTFYKSMIDSMSIRSLASPNFNLAIRNHIESNFRLKKGGLVTYSKRFDRWFVKHLLRDCVQQSLLAAIVSPDRIDQLAAIKLYRVLLSTKQDGEPHTKEIQKTEADIIDHIVSIGIIPRVVDIMANKYEEEDHVTKDLQFEAAWILSNIAYGTTDHVKAITEAGAISAFVTLLKSTDTTVIVKEQALWGLANIAAEQDFRCSLLNNPNGLIETIEHFVSNDSDPAPSENIIINSAWLIHNLLRGMKDTETIEPSILWRLMTSIKCIMVSTENEHALTDIACAMKQIVKVNGEQNLAAMMCNPSGSGIMAHSDIQRIMKLARHANANIRRPIRDTLMYTMRHISTNDNQLLDDIIASC